MPDALTLERVAHYPMPGMNAPVSVRFSPDGRLLTYLWSEDSSLVRQLWAYDVQTRSARLLLRAVGEGDTDATVSADETLRRERLRMRGFGITSYAWAETRNILLVPMLGRVYVSDDEGEHLRELATGGEAIDPHLSPDSQRVAYVQHGELWVIDTTEGSLPAQLTFDASPVLPNGEQLITNGLAEFIAQEEMGRASGFWWSRDGANLAFAQVDVSAVTPFSIAHDFDNPPESEQHRYPFAGGTNARVRLAVIGADGSNRRWVPLGDDSDLYLARVDWAPDGGLYFQVESRDQRKLELRRYDPVAATLDVVIREESAGWINLHDDLRFVRREGAADDDYQILWSSERSGFRHLYLYNRDGGGCTQITSGDWPVDRVVDAHGGCVYFLAGAESPLERHVYRVCIPSPHDSGARPDSIAMERLTKEPGVHAAVLAPDGKLFADLWDSANRAPGLDLRAEDGRRIDRVFENPDNEAQRLELGGPEFFTTQADDGTLLHAAFYPAMSAAAPAPLIVSVYGGPHVQQVSNSWSMTVDLRTQYLRRLGFAVLKLDNRGSARRGLAFERAIAENLGDHEVRDQLAGIRAVSNRPDVDGSRVGVYGWSYGGYMTLMCMLQQPDVFRAGVAGAPVTDWDGYDTHYTERYMRSPAQNARGYQESSALGRAGNLAGELLLVHGMIDENVHFRHTVRLVDALIAAQKPFRLLPFPHERHMPRREEDRCFMEKQVVEHFRRFL
jgi:dipeptidyl-peptidase-4